MNIKRLNQIKIENIIWIIYFFLIGLCLYGNYYESDYFKYNNIYSKEKYRKINIFIFCIAVIIYYYFFQDNYKEYKATPSNFNGLSLIGSTLVLISGLIFLYIAIVDINLETEISFN